jgi:hypothetical protein
MKHIKVQSYIKLYILSKKVKRKKYFSREYEMKKTIDE